MRGRGCLNNLKVGEGDATAWKPSGRVCVPSLGQISKGRACDG